MTIAKSLVRVARSALVITTFYYAWCVIANRLVGELTQDIKTYLDVKALKK